MGMMDQRWLPVVLAIGLGGCNSQWNYERERAERANTTFPPNYRAEILSYMRTYLNDPSGVRDAFVSEPALRFVDGANRYSVCLRYNPKRTDGRYGGSRDNLVL